MSLRTLWKLGRTIATDAIVRPETEKLDLPRKDLDLPLGGRIGALLQIKDGQLNVAQILGSIVTPPSTGQVTITAISRPRPDGWPEDL